MTAKIALIGFGEAGRTFAGSAGWASSACAFDKLTLGPDFAPIWAEYQAAKVTGCDSLALATAQAEIILSVVTADAALGVAQETAQNIQPGVYYFDMNSVAPETKRAAAACIDDAGGHYVDVAVMAPVNPLKMAVPLFVSGPMAEEGAAGLRAMGFENVRVVGNTVGRASTIKMLRSVMY